MPMPLTTGRGTSHSRPRNGREKFDEMMSKWRPSPTDTPTSLCLKKVDAKKDQVRTILEADTVG